jgi:hypothetical protein
MQPSNETSRKAGPGAPRKPKAATTRQASSKGKSGKEADGLALDAPEPSVSPDTAGTGGIGSETKPSKRRGKIGLFKNTSSEPVSSDGADMLPASAPADDGPTGSEETPSATTHEKRGTKRTAREPKPGAA